MWQFLTILSDLVKMDLSVEASSGTRVLTARHISPDKSFPETDIAINSTLLCHSYSQNPDFASYFSGILYNNIFLNAFWHILFSSVLIVKTKNGNKSTTTATTYKLQHFPRPQQRYLSTYYVHLFMKITISVFQ